MDNFWLSRKEARISYEKTYVFLNLHDRSIIETHFLEIWSSSPHQENNYYLSEFIKVTSDCLNEDKYSAFSSSNSFNTWMSAWCNVCADPQYKSRLDVLDAVDTFVNP